MTGPAADTKAALRRTVLVQRRSIHAARHTEAAQALAARVAAEIPAKGNIIAGYWPIGDEIDCKLCLETLKAAGADVALPVAAGQGQVLIFRSWCPGDALEPGPFGTQHPAPRSPVVAPRVLLMPLVAFDRAGNRLGYGAGYYDRTVAALRQQRPIIAIGIAYDEQEIADVPSHGHDQKLDAVITDRRTLWFNDAARPKDSEVV